MKVQNPWNSYRQVATQTASKGQLVLMLYDGIVRFLEKSLLGFAKEDFSEKNEVISNNILRAQAIIHELDVCLNVEEGGELAATLRRLYDYMDRRLVESNTTKSEEGIKEVIQRVTILRDAWSNMLQGNTINVPAPDAELVAA